MTSDQSQIEKLKEATCQLKCGDDEAKVNATSPTLGRPQPDAAKLKPPHHPVSNK